MRKIHLLLTLVALSLATSSLWALPTGVVDGKLSRGFVINSNCDSVRFSQGNLQYIGNTAEPYWKFADEQYEFLGNTTGQNNEGNNINRDLFVFGANWGANAISNGGDSPNSGWRTLTSNEFNYLLTGRKTGNIIKAKSDASYTMAQILTDGSGTNGITYNIKGIILFPDRYTGGTPSGVTWGDINTNGDLTTCTTAGWEALEAAGCVFLPAAGYRYGNTLGDVGNKGYYWLSYYDNTRAYYIPVNHKPYYNYDYKTKFFSVRLVKDAPFVQQNTAYTPPIANDNLVYNGGSQFLIKIYPTYANGCSPKYKVGTSGSWSGSTPTATNAGEYIVYWYIDHLYTCYNNSPIEEIHVTIARGTAAAPNPMPTIAAAASLTYNGNPQDLVTATGDIQSGYTTVYSTDGINWSTTIPQGTNAGDYTVYYKFYKGDNYEYVPSPNTIDANIAKADLPGVTLPEATSTIPYDGTEKTLLEIDPVANATIWYKLGDGDWTTTPPTRTDAGDYSVQYKIVPDDPNYNTIGPNTVTVTILDYPTVYDNADPTTKLAELLNTPSDLKVKRTIYADDEYNTICLPFALDESALAASPLAGFNRLKTFKGAQVTGTAPDLYIDIFVEDATTIEAGIPYLITYPAAHADIVNPVFHGITVTTTEPSAVSVDGITFQGMFAQVHIDPYDAGHTQDYLFVGANSQLYWPSSDQTSSSIKMRGFRAYFIIDRNSISPALAPKGTRARIMDAPKTTTGIENTSATFGGSEKIIENGILYIIRNGVKYNAQGQVVK